MGDQPRPPRPAAPAKKDQFIVMYGTRLPAPTGVNCPDHPTFATVWMEGEPWCRFGQHFPWMEHGLHGYTHGTAP